MTLHKTFKPGLATAIALTAFVFASMFTVVQTGHAQGTDRIQNYFSDTAVKVKAADNPAEKRIILDTAFSKMTEALNQIETAGWASANDKNAARELKATILDKRDELAGINGYAPVPDGQLNAFADYVVQGTEQAKQTVTIGVVAALLIVVILLLI